MLFIAKMSQQQRLQQSGEEQRQKKPVPGKPLPRADDGMRFLEGQGPEHCDSSEALFAITASTVGDWSKMTL